MKVALLNHTFASTDGQGKVNARVAAYLLDAGHQVTLIGDGVSNELVQRPGAAVISLPPARRLPTQLLKDVAFGRQSAAVIRRLRRDHDVVVANGGMSFAATDVNLCHFVHRSWLRSDQHPLRSASQVSRAWGLYQYAYSQQACVWERDAYQRAKRVVAVSALVKQQLVDDVGVDPSKIVVIENGVDLAPAPTEADQIEARRKLGLNDDQFAIFFAGDLRTPRKNFDVLLRSLKNLTPDVILIAAGNHEDGPYPRLAEDMGVVPRVRFLGMRSDLPTIYPAADVFACLSHYDPFGLVITEAMSAAIPVITSSTVGASSVVTDSNAGFVIADPNDDHAVADAVRQLMADPAPRKAYGLNARAGVERLSWDRIGARYGEVLQEVIDLRQHPRGAS